MPDWPLAYGRLMPPLTGNVLFAQGHRIVAASVGLLTLGLAIWLSLVEKRAWLRRLGWIALAAVIVQAVLGGVSVLLLLPPAVSVSHACLAQLFFSLTVAIALFTSRGWQHSPELVVDHGWPSLRSLAIVTPTVVLLQIALGAGFRHRAMGVMSHFLGAMIVALLILMVCIFVTQQFPGHRRLRLAAKTLMIIAFLQVFLGISVFTIESVTTANTLPVVLATVGHVAMGALTLAASVVVAIQIRCHVCNPAAEEDESSPTPAAS